MALLIKSPDDFIQNFAGLEENVIFAYKFNTNHYVEKDFVNFRKTWIV